MKLIENKSAVHVLSKIMTIKIQRSIILLLFLNEREICSLTFREEHWLKVFENRLLPKISGSKRDEVTEEWRRLHNEEL
jgi:hypothetical protein